MDRNSEHVAETTEQLITRHAEKLWEGAGRPAGGAAAYVDQARELAAIEENYRSTLKPVEAVGPYGEPIEENIAMENLGDFPTLTDQGDEQTFPDTAPGDVAEAGRVTLKTDGGRPTASGTPPRRETEGLDEDVADEESDEDDEDADDEDEDEDDEDDGVSELDGDLDKVLEDYEEEEDEAK